MLVARSKGREAHATAGRLLRLCLLMSPTLALALGCMILGHGSVADGAPRKPLKMPSSVLTDDDPCLDDLSGERAECGTALLQSKNSRRPAKTSSPGGVRKTPGRPGSVIDATSSAPIKAASLLEQMKGRIGEFVASGQSTNEVGRLASSYAKLIAAEAMPSIQASFNEHQSLLQKQVKSFDRCDVDLQGRLETDHQLRAVHSRWSRLHQDCRSSERDLGHELQRCKQQHALVQVHEGIEKQADQSNSCREAQESLGTKTAECKSLERSMHTANCARASQVSGICDMYGLCRASLALAYGSAKEAAKSWENYHKTELLAVSAIRCLAERSIGGSAQDGLAISHMLEDCEQHASNTTTHKFDYPDMPLPMECTDVSASDTPCAEEVNAAKIGMVAADDARRSERPKVDLSEAIDGLSLMQQDAESVSMVLPKQMLQWHQGLFRPLATPISMIVVMLTVLILVFRCSTYLCAKRSKRAELLAVDAWCNKSLDSLNAQTMGIQLSASGDSVCPELIVPARSKCAVMLSRLGIKEGALRAVQVTDKLGQPLFKASLVSSTDQAAFGNATEKLMLTTQDGTVLMTCLLSLPRGTSEGHCAFVRRDGTHFASMLWDTGNVTLFSRLVARKRDDEGAFVVKSDHNSLLRILPIPGGTGNGLVRLSDALRRSVAEADFQEANLAGRCHEVVRIEVCSECAIDLGLVTAAVIAVDRLSFHMR